MDNSNTSAAAMYCHACHHQWQRNTDTIECPACHSASTEIITPENDPRLFHNMDRQPSETPVPVPADQTPASPEHDTRDAPAPGSEHEPQTQPQPQPQTQAQEQHQQHASHPQVVFMLPQPAVTLFTTVVTDTHVPPPNAFGPRGPPVSAHVGLNFFFPPMVHVAAPPPPPSTAGTATDATTGEQPQPQAQPAGMPLFVTNLLNAISLFTPGGSMLGGGGDAVFSQEALDRIVTQLREQQTGPVGAPPASQAAIDKIEVRELDAAMCDGEGEGKTTTTRCVICVDDMAVGEKAAVLPCRHFFHGECVTPWLKQHNTCPVCRRSVEVEKSQSVNKAAEFVASETTQTQHDATECP